jgi:hypothetical protein
MKYVLTLLIILISSNCYSANMNPVYFLQGLKLETNIQYSELFKYKPTIDTFNVNFYYEKEVKGNLLKKLEDKVFEVENTPEGIDKIKAKVELAIISRACLVQAILIDEELKLYKKSLIMDIQSMNNDYIILIHNIYKKYVDNISNTRWNKLVEDSKRNILNAKQSLLITQVTKYKNYTITYNFIYSRNIPNSSEYKLISIVSKICKFDFSIMSLSSGCHKSGDITICDTYGKNVKVNSLEFPIEICHQKEKIK